MDANVARRRLEAEWERLLEVQNAVAEEHLSDTTEDESSGELSPIDQHQADAGSEVFEREMEFSVRDLIDADLQEVYDAFRRLDRSTYGRCVTCGAPISDTRLAAAPSTRFCVDHERLWELRSLALPFPAVAIPDGAASAEDIAEYEAIHHLEFLPDDDQTEERDELGPEEGALHYTDGAPHEALRADEVERAEAARWDDAADEHDARETEELEHKHEADAVALEESELDALDDAMDAYRAMCEGDLDGRAVIVPNARTQGVRRRHDGEAQGMQ